MPRVTSLRRAVAIAALLAQVVPVRLSAETPPSLEGEELAVTGELGAGV